LVQKIHDLVADLAAPSRPSRSSSDTLPPSDQNLKGENLEIPREIKIKGWRSDWGENRRFDDLIMKGRNWRRDPGVRGTLPAMMSQQSSLVLCLAEGGRRGGRSSRTAGRAAGTKGGQGGWRGARTSGRPAGAACRRGGRPAQTAGVESRVAAA